MNAPTPPPPATGWRAKTPNALTVLRLAMTGACVACLALYDADEPAAPLAWAALALFVVASVTDALDGYLARRWNAVSRFGRVMDPLADKVLVLGVFIVLAGANFVRHGEGADTQVTGVWAWMPVVALTRELLVTSLRGVYESSGVDFSATWTGKIKMIVQALGLSLILLSLALHQGGGDGVWLTVSAASAWAITVVTAASMAPYIAKALRAAEALR